MVARQSFLTKRQTPFDLGVNIVENLAMGAAQVTVAKRLKTSKQLVSYYARRATQLRILTRITKSPAIYSAGPNFSEMHIFLHGVKKPLAWVRGKSKTNPLTLPKILHPHRLGFRFVLKRPLSNWKPYGFNKTNSKLKNSSQWVKREPDIKMVAYRNKIQFWVHLTHGRSPKKQVVNAVALVNARAKQMATDINNLLLYESTLQSPEWEVSNQPIADYLTTLLEKKHKPLTLGKAKIIQDSSHLNPEIVGENTTNMAENLDWLVVNGKPLFNEIASITKTIFENQKQLTGITKNLDTNVMTIRSLLDIHTQALAQLKESQEDSPRFSNN